MWRIPAFISTTSCINFSQCAGGFPKPPALLAACLARCVVRPPSLLPELPLRPPTSSHLTPSLAPPSSSAALLPRPSVPLSSRIAAWGHLAVPRACPVTWRATYFFVPLSSHRTAARGHLAVPRYLARYFSLLSHLQQFLSRRSTLSQPSLSSSAVFIPRPSIPTCVIRRCFAC
jgi:hypothetical protein